MDDKKLDNKDCEVCKRLIREKHKYDFIWKIACLLFALLAIVFIILYFADGVATETTTINLDGAQIETSGDENEVTIGGGHYEITGTAETKDNTAIICITVVAAVTVLVIGGIIIAVQKKDR